jgi:protein TonB
LDSIKYFIKKVPLDTTLDEHMPTYQPDGFVTVDVSPIPIKQVQPEYPPEARQSKSEGTVWVKCLVGKDGKVTKVNILHSDAKVFNKSAISAAKRWEFSPGRLKNKPIEVWVSIPFRFRLSK